jgi:catecholate siderophore receptor
VFVDGMRDPAFYERDTFFYDRLEVLRGSASMLFGRGSTGGAVNQVSKLPRAMDEHQVDLTLGNHRYGRLVGDFNFKLGAEAALRVGAMVTQADNNGAGSSLDKKGAAATLRWGIGTRDEFSIAGLPPRQQQRHELRHAVGPANGHVDRRRDHPAAAGPQPTTAWPATSTAARPTTLTATHTATASTASHEITQDAPRRATNATSAPARCASAMPPRSPTAGRDAGHLRPATRDHARHAAEDPGPGHLVRAERLQRQVQRAGLRHEVQAGIDVAREDKTVYAARNARQGGVNLASPPPPSAHRRWRLDRRVHACAAHQQRLPVRRRRGLRAGPDPASAPAWKLLLGLRYDTLTGDYNSLRHPEQRGRARDRHQLPHEGVGVEQAAGPAVPAHAS